MPLVPVVGRTKDQTQVWNHRTGVRDLHHQDRKSTRLNSSHPSICTRSLHDALPIFPAAVATPEKEKVLESLTARSPQSNPADSAATTHPERSVISCRSYQWSDVRKTRPRCGITGPVFVTFTTKIGRAHV